MFNQFGNPMPFRQVAPSVMMQNPYAAPAPMAFNAPAAPSAGYGAPAAAAAAPAAAPTGYGAPAAAAAAPAAAPATYDPTPAAYAYEEEANETLVEKSEAETVKPDCYYSQGPPSTPATIFRWPTAVQPTFGFPMRDAASQFMQPAQPMQSFQPMRDVNGVQFMQPVQSMQTLQPQSMHPMQSMQTLQPMSSMQTLQPMPSMQSMQNMQQMQQMQSMQAAQPTFHSVGSPMTATGFGMLT